MHVYIVYMYECEHRMNVATCGYCSSPEVALNIQVHWLYRGNTTSAIEHVEYLFKKWIKEN